MGSVRGVDSLDLEESKDTFCVALKLSERRIEVRRKLHGQRLEGDRTDHIGNTDIVETSWSCKVVLSVAESLGKLRIE